MFIGFKTPKPYSLRLDIGKIGEKGEYYVPVY
jgi:hypothetical protein